MLGPKALVLFGPRVWFLLLPRAWFLFGARASVVLAPGMGLDTQDLDHLPDNVNNQILSFYAQFPLYIKNPPPIKSY